MYSFPSFLWEPQKRGLRETMDHLDAGRHVCLYGPTGSGKTVQAMELMAWAMDRKKTCAFIVNRTLLLQQTLDKFAEAGIPFGVRAAGFDDLYDFSAPVQICSAQTEVSRVSKRAIQSPLDVDYMIVDEAHLQKAKTMTKIINDHKDNGGMAVLLTATPVGLSHLSDTLVIPGTLQEYRDCGALVAARSVGVSVPDLRKIKRQQTGEFIMNGQKKKLFTQSIVGDVVEYWEKENPYARPTLLYAPDVASSRYLTDRFRAKGVNWCHVDSTTAEVDGHRAKLTRRLWNEILDRFKAGDIKGISSRFKLREGIDVPMAYHCILACPIGSLASYIQTVGRILRYSPETPDEVVITDHGGNYDRFGSCNWDRDWSTWWDMSEYSVSEMFQANIKEGNTSEPYCCPECGTQRMVVNGHICPHCGHEHMLSRRRVRMENGDLVVKEGVLTKPKIRKVYSNTQQKWNDLYYCYRNRKHRLSFRSMRGFFEDQNHYCPPNNLNNMPQRPEDWFRYVYTVEQRNLHMAIK